MGGHVRAPSFSLGSTLTVPSPSTGGPLRAAGRWSALGSWCLIMALLVQADSPLFPVTATATEAGVFANERRGEMSREVESSGDLC